VQRAPDLTFAEKSRFTLFSGVNVEGGALPAFIVIYASSKDDLDLTNCRVLKMLQSNHPEYFGRGAGWVYGRWSRELWEASAKGEKKKKLYKRPYLLNELTGEVITVQEKAWMDSPGMCMWADLIMSPIVKGRGTFHLHWQRFAK
jgi:hypothetical protein